MDGKTLKSTRLANRDMAILAGNILRQAIIIDVTPTDDCYSMLYNQIRIHHERSLIPYVRLVDFWQDQSWERANTYQRHKNCCKTVR